MTNNSLLTGQVVSSFGTRYQVELSDGTLWDCITRGKKHDVACGDLVEIHATAKDSAVIENIHPRSCLLYRSNAFRTKLLAANVTQIVVVLAAVPSFYESLLNRCLIAASHAQIRALIVLNKSDLAEAELAWQKLQAYQTLGYELVQLSAKQDISPLRAFLKNQTSILVGQSGMGKSTMINALLPEQKVRTREVSEVLDSGKHTTTATHLYHLDASSHIIDSPGLQEFGLYHLTIDELEQAWQSAKTRIG